jgi:ferritin-like metal-binding protein YciE
MKLELLEDLYLEELRDLYDAEQRLIKALLKMAKAVQAEELCEAFMVHRKETQRHVERLEQIFSRLGKEPGGKKCKAMMGLIAEAKDFMGEEAERELVDVGLITVAQKVEHYEIAGYGCVATYAKLLGFEEDARELHQTLVEEKAADEKLTQLARNINVEAAATGGSSPQSEAGAANV